MKGKGKDGIGEKNKKGRETEDMRIGEGNTLSLAKFLDLRMRPTESKATRSKSGINNKTAMCISDSNSGSGR